MAERSGWICLHRTLLDHPLMEQLPAAWLRVWVVILLTVNWKPGVWWDGKAEVQIEPGQLITSVEKLSKKAHVSVKQTRGCLNYLQAAKMAAIETASRYTFLTVLNWDTYQSDDQAEGKVNGELDGEVGARSGQSEGKVGATIEQSNNTTREYKSNSNRNPKPGIDPDTRLWFETEFWPIYPRHEAKQKSLEAAAKVATSLLKRAHYLDRLNAQLPEYSRRKAESGQRVIPLGATWFNQERADDDLPLQAPAALGPRRIVDTDYPEYVPLGVGK